MQSMVAGTLGSTMWATLDEAGFSADKVRLLSEIHLKEAELTQLRHDISFAQSDRERLEGEVEEVRKDRLKAENEAEVKAALEMLAASKDRLHRNELELCDLRRALKKYGVANGSALNSVTPQAPKAEPETAPVPAAIAPQRNKPEPSQPKATPSLRRLVVSKVGPLSSTAPLPGQSSGRTAGRTSPGRSSPTTASLRSSRAMARSGSGLR